MANIKLIVGLGNPGEHYANTRHNIGFRAVALLAENSKAGWKKWSGIAEISKPGEFEGIILAKPATFMNNSGLAVKEISGYFGISHSEIIVLSDDFSLPLGALRLRQKGSAGGHNGLQSIIEHLGTTDFPRLRLGIGPVSPCVDPADFVLSNFAQAEKKAAEKMVEEAVLTLKKLIEVGFEKTMSQLQKPKTSD